MKLKTGDVVRCRNAHNYFVGRVILAASGGDRQSVLIDIGETAVRVADGGLVLGYLALRIDYDAETVVDLFGEEWTIDVNDVAEVER